MPRRYIAPLLIVAIVLLLASLTPELIDGRSWYRIYLSVYLMVTTAAMVVAIFGQPRWRPAALGTAIFGVSYFVFMLLFRLGFNGRFGGYSASDELFSEMKTGFVLLAIACLGTQLAMEILGPRCKEPEATEKLARPRPEEKLGPVD